MGSTTAKYQLPYPAETDTADVPRDVQALAQRLEVVLPNVGIPTGMGADWYAAAAPPGFLLCDGSAVSRATYAALFAVLGTVWGGGDGINTFNLPDCRGRVIVGRSPGGIAEVATLGGNDGTAVGSRRVRHAHTIGLTAGHNLSLPDHWHNTYDPGHSHSEVYGRQGIYGPTGGGDSAMSGGVPHDTIQLTNNTTGLQVQSPQSYPGINGGVQLNGTIGITGGTADGPSFVVANKVVKT